MTVPVQPGTIIAGKYRITHMIGQGGMGFVVAAEQAQLGRHVAIKFLRAGTDPVVVERFAREARIAVKLQSEHVCHVLDVGARASGEPYIVMELMHGQDLKDLVRQSGPMQVMVAVDYMLQACEALAEAHVLGVVHRDLKPSNLFVTRRPDGSACIKVLDFGISKLWSEPDPAQPAHGQGAAGHHRAIDAAPQHLTMTGAILGSPRFVSPEQIADVQAVDNRTDIWAIGAVLHELLNGRAAFDAETVGELCFSILNDDPTPIDRPDMPQSLQAVLTRCMSKDPAGRYANIAELALALQPFGTGTENVCVDRCRTIYEATGWRGPTIAAPPKLRSKYRLMFGTAAAMLLLGVGSVAAMYAADPESATPVASASPSASTSSDPYPAHMYPCVHLCDRSMRLDPSVPVEPEQYIAAATKFVRTTRPEAKLSAIQAGLKGTHIDRHQTVSFYFIYNDSDGTPRRVHAYLQTPYMSISSSEPNTNMGAAAPPVCNLQQALEASYALGIPRDERVQANYFSIRGAHPVWAIKASHSEREVHVDQVCRATLYAEGSP